MQVMTDWSHLQEEIGVSFNDLSLLQQAFIHRSYLNENPDSVPGSNERLEFLGDAFLGFVIADTLYQQFDNLNEGEMTKIRSALVCQTSLAHVASRLKLGEYLYLGQGEEKGGGRHRSRNLACVVEALIGTTLVDQGVKVAADFILRLFDESLRQVVEEGIATDHKSRLQELVQARKQDRPIYRLVEEEGPDHNKRFWVEAVVEGKVLGRGCGKSKQLAEKEAAKIALQRWKES